MVSLMTFVVKESKEIFPVIWYHKWGKASSDCKKKKKWNEFSKQPIYHTLKPQREFQVRRQDKEHQEDSSVAPREAALKHSPRLCSEHLQTPLWCFFFFFFWEKSVVVHRIWRSSSIRHYRLVFFWSSPTQREGISFMLQFVESTNCRSLLEPHCFYFTICWCAAARTDTLRQSVL